MDDPLRFACASGGIENVEQILCIHLLGITLIRLNRHDVVPPVIFSLLPIDFVFTATQDNNVFNRLLTHQRIVDILFEGHNATSAPGAVLCDDRFTRCIVDSFPEAFCTEAPEHYRMSSTDSRAGKHGDDDFRYHAHVDGDGVSLTHSQFLQGVGGSTNFPQQLCVGECLRITRLSLPVECNSIRARLDMAVETRFGDIEGPPDEPAIKRSIAVIQNLLPGLFPAQFLGLGDPKCVRIRIPKLVDIWLRIGILSQIFGRRKRAALLKEVFDGL